MITRAEAYAAIARWEARELERAELIAFNNGPDFPPFEDVLHPLPMIVTDMEALAQSNWRAVQDMPTIDATVATELHSVGLPIKKDYPAVENLREDFAKSWVAIRNARIKMTLGKGLSRNNCLMVRIFGARLCSSNRGESRLARY